MIEESRVIFTEEMRKEYTILVPTMLPTHFKMLVGIFRSYGLNAVLLENSGQPVIDCGLRYVHNDTCYPALLVIGQMIDAIETGGYDPHKVALMITQTGGGCRASNYIFLLRKALNKAGYGYVPVISLNFSNLEKNPGFKLTLSMLDRMVYAVLYGDLLMLLQNQCRPYEALPGSTAKLTDEWTARLLEQMKERGMVQYRRVKENYRAILRDFAALPRRNETKLRVGIVGEIFVKFSPLGNNNLEQFLLSEGCEPVVPGLLDFCLYCVYNSIADHELYGTGALKAKVVEAAYRFLLKKQQDIIDFIEEQGVFRPMTPFEITRSLTKGYVGIGAKMGEGWLLTAEMLELAHENVKNIVCTQPFGCLPNHIVGKGMMKQIKEKNPGVNIVAVDYDAGATRINQENRIKLMLANARQNEQAAESAAVPEPVENTPVPAGER